MKGKHKKIVFLLSAKLLTGTVRERQISKRVDVWWDDSFILSNAFMRSSVQLTVSKHMFHTAIEDFMTDYEHCVHLVISAEKSNLFVIVWLVVATAYHAHTKLGRYNILVANSMVTTYMYGRRSNGSVYDITVIKLTHLINWLINGTVDTVDTLKLGLLQTKIYAGIVKDFALITSKFRWSLLFVVVLVSYKWNANSWWITPADIHVYS